MEVENHRFSMRKRVFLLGPSMLVSQSVAVGKVGTTVFGKGLQPNHHDPLGADKGTHPKHGLNLEPIWAE